MKRIHLLFLSLFIFFLFSCQNNSSDKEVPSLSDSTSITQLGADSVKLVKTASVNFKVKDVDQSTKDVSVLAQKFGGMLYNQHLESTEDGRKELPLSKDSLLVVSVATTHADMTARIPAQNLEAFLFEVGNLGYYTTNRQLQIDDRSLQYLENQLKQKNRKEVLSSSPARRTGFTRVAQTIASGDEAIDQEIANRQIDADVNYSVVNLALFQNAVVKKEVIANYNVSSYDLSLGQRFKNAIAEGADYFISFTLALLHLWLFILLGIVIYVSYRLWQQKRKLSKLNVTASS